MALLSGEVVAAADACDGRRPRRVLRAAIAGRAADGYYDNGMARGGRGHGVVTIGGKHTLTRKSALRCTICGKAAPPGALLCPPCRAALKRAGHLTVQDLPHYLAPVRRPRGKGRASADESPRKRVARASAPTRAWVANRRVFVAVGALAALAALAYLGQPHPGPHPGAPTAGRLADSESSPAAVAAPAGADTPSAASSAAAATATTPPAQAPAVIEPARPVAAGRGPPRTKQAALRADAVVAASELPVAESAAPAPPPPVQAPRETPPPPDRWQQMNDALARCDREGGFSGFICDQRVRLDSCEGYWGKVPQCPNPPENPR